MPESSNIYFKNKSDKINAQDFLLFGAFCGNTGLVLSFTVQFSGSLKLTNFHQIFRGVRTVKFSSSTQIQIHKKFLSEYQIKFRISRLYVNICTSQLYLVTEKGPGNRWGHDWQLMCFWYSEEIHTHGNSWKCLQMVQWSVKHSHDHKLSWRKVKYSTFCASEHSLPVLIVPAVENTLLILQE